MYRNAVNTYKYFDRGHIIYATVLGVNLTAQFLC